MMFSRNTIQTKKNEEKKTSNKFKKQEQQIRSIVTSILTFSSYQEILDALKTLWISKLLSDWQIFDKNHPIREN